ncbi:DUF4386 domain-containing protein [Lacihabitans sp. LS3-19]|uniref:DUF4386 domain-containing protein n=1 Tax=Lacihabitans sp. LS3-19 TaxID=2487335 RepID=UPI0020CD6BE9|nr:DUF4386 domain-containing protein [Lacihabitans sp. LS3-19]MCP9767986.1 DUF4386 domain-containing protein [Lacihabitans sp. LS3-19]
MNKNRTFAKITGYSLFLMAIIAGFAFGFVLPKIFNPSQLDLVKINLASNLPLYKWMLLAIIAILLLDLLVSWTLYVYFKNDNKKIALLSSILRIAYTLIFGIATYYLTKNLNYSEKSKETIIQNFQLFQSTWSAGLIIFGIHLFFVGVLIKLHSKIPKILGFLALIAGISYVIVHFLKLTVSPSDLVSNLEMILALPMAIGELGLAFWLIIKGGKDSKLE